jgi:hypothetical protein
MLENGVKREQVKIKAFLPLPSLPIPEETKFETKLRTLLRNGRSNLEPLNLRNGLDCRVAAGAAPRNDRQGRYKDRE